MHRLIFFFTELSAQFINNPHLQIVRKHLPVGLHFMTGETANVRIDITSRTGPLQVVETRLGNIVAIIDNMDYLRAIKNLKNKIVQVQPRFNNRISYLTTTAIRRYQLIFDERVPNH